MSVAVVTRLRTPAPSPDATQGGLGRTLGTDPIAEDETAAALSLAFDKVVRDIADRRGRDDD